MGQKYICQSIHRLLLQKHFCTSSLPQHCNFSPLEYLFIKSSQNHHSSTFPYAKVLQLFLRLKSVGKQETELKPSSWISVPNIMQTRNVCSLSYTM